VKKQLSIILSILSVCSLLSASIEASDFDGTLQEKGSKAKSKAKITMSGSSCCQGNPGNQGATGPAGPTGPTGPFSPVFATLARNERSEVFSGAGMNPITVPLDEIDFETAEGVTFSAANHTFTLPKGFYTIHFEFTMALENDNFQPTAFRFTNIYLDLNGDSSRIPLSWIMSINDWNLLHSEDPPADYWATFSGSKTFKISQDGTVAKFMIRRLTDNLDGIRFERLSSSNGGYHPGEEEDNVAVRITLHKIKDL